MRSLTKTEEGVASEPSSVGETGHETAHASAADAINAVVGRLLSIVRRMG
jgi:hypothetical protein